MQRIRAPVLAGVPLPPNAGVIDVEAFELRDSNGRSVPFNARVLARWNRPAHDLTAPIKWLALGFSADLQPGGTAAFELVPGTVASASADIAWAEPGGIQVDTGAIGFHVATEGSNLLENLHIDMNGDRRVDIRLVGDRGAEIRWPGAEGMAAAPLQARLVSSGPAAAVVRIEAAPAQSSSASAVVWLHAYRDQPWIRVVIRTCGGAATDIARIHVPIETLGDPLRATVGMAPGNAENAWLPAESFPLDARSTARIVRQGDEMSWSAQLDGQTFWTDESVAWAEFGSLGWSVAAAASPTSDGPVRSISLAGSGAIEVDVAPTGGRCTTAELFLQFRAGVAGETREFLDFQSPLVAAAEASWLRDSLALGPIGIGVTDTDAAGTAMDASDDWDPAFGLLASWLGDQGAEAAWLRAAARRVGVASDTGFGERTRGALLYFWLTGDPRIEEALAAAGTTLIRGSTGRVASPWLALAQIDTWEVSGSTAHLQAAQIGLRAAAVALHTTACASDPMTAGLVLEGLGRYTWARRLAQRPDRQAEQALHQLLDQALACPTASLMADGFAYGALLTEDSDRRRAYMRAAEASLRAGAPMAAASEEAALRLRTGQTYAWLRARLAVEGPRRGQ